MRPWCRHLGALCLALALMVSAASGPGRLRAQALPELHLVRTGGEANSVTLSMTRGFAAVRAAELASLGWTPSVATAGATLEGPAGARMELRAGSPFFRWDGAVLQLADAPYVEAGQLFVPVQLLTDFLPRRLPDVYAFDGASMTLRWTGVGDAVAGGPSGVAAPPPAAETAPTENREQTVTLLPDGGVRVVIIDAGHGGKDPGTIGRGNIEEKTVALGVARALAADLEKVPGLEVHLTRDTDTLVALWDRGQIATRLKGDRPGVFISIHANSVTSGRSARGFETYFLSEARTEHERRVAAIENAPLGVDTTAGGANGDLDFILRELKNLDTQHWSSLLAQMVQTELGKVHPGPDRGVKQAPLAVITNALMPAVLVEVGYLSNPDEARLLARPAFQKEAAEAIATAVQHFFERYPPGSGSVGGGKDGEEP